MYVSRMRDGHTCVHIWRLEEEVMSNSYLLVCSVVSGLLIESETEVAASKACES